MKKFIVILVCVFSIPDLTIQAQPLMQLTLNDCYTLATKNYPLVKQQELIAKTVSYSIENLHKGYLPQLNVVGQATYQSAVTEIPIKLPGVSIPTLSKDQYRVYGEVNQLLYDGGLIEQQKQLQKANEKIEQQKLETELYGLKERINQLYFGVLLIDEQLKQSRLLIKDIQLGLNKVQAAIDYGTALKSNADILKADLLKNNQRTIELKAGRLAYTTMLSVFIGKTIGEQTILIKPAPVKPSATINRPELLVYNEQSKTLDIQNMLLKIKTLPKVGLFLQTGIGRPALNMLINNLECYYIGGIRLNWSPSAFYTLKKDRALADISRRNIDVQKETFLFNTNLLVQQQCAEIGKYQQLLASDDEIIALRIKVKNTSLAQLENGVINANDYLREVNAEDQARQTKILHEIQLLMSQYNQQTTTGNQL